MLTVALMEECAQSAAPGVLDALLDGGGAHEELELEESEMDVGMVVESPGVG